jgi:hypothetical protein
MNNAIIPVDQEFQADRQGRLGLHCHRHPKYIDTHLQQNTYVPDFHWHHLVRVNHSDRVVLADQEIPPVLPVLVHNRNTNLDLIDLYNLVLI